jgi:glutamyl-Q tRNA(Asp) synthetase
MSYTGRFAPTPTGPLHTGSLIAAVASYCDARAAGGKWLLRMEDIDPPREMPGAADLILRQLHAYGLEWDGEVLFQHQRTEAYLAALEQLQEQGDVFWCCCSRTDLVRLGTTAYPGTCRPFTSPRDDAAIRLRVPDRLIRFNDRLFGPQAENLQNSIGDVVLRRRDGLFAYQLAVVVDDAFQNITDVVRGADLLDNTARQVLLQEKLGVATPRYLHLPLMLHADGSKLSKQTFAPALPLPATPALLWQVLMFLGQKIPADLQHATPDRILHWAIQNWTPGDIPRQHGMSSLPA